MGGWTKDGQPRATHIFEAAAWRSWFINPAQRCLIPITAFAEAEGEKGKMTSIWLSVADQPLAACAGLWRPTDEWGDCYTMVMVDATAELFDIHERMPVILHAADHDASLQAPPEEATCRGSTTSPKR